jgi:uncharacterized protein (DUF1697 family)
MSTFIALLRGINVGGHRKISMSDLRTVASDAGFDDVRTILQTGNLVFTASRGSATSIERKLEEATERELGVRTDFLVRTADEWADIVSGNPFEREAESHPSHLLLLVLQQPPSTEAVAKIQEQVKGRERIGAGERHLYVSYPDGIGTSKLTSALIERALGTKGTARNWNTVLKIAQTIG